MHVSNQLRDRVPNRCHGLQLGSGVASSATNNRKDIDFEIVEGVKECAKISIHIVAPWQRPSNLAKLPQPPAARATFTRIRKKLPSSAGSVEGVNVTYTIQVTCTIQKDRIVILAVYHGAQQWPEVL
jgi:hypothetical protein